VAVRIGGLFFGEQLLGLSGGFGLALLFQSIAIGNHAKESLAKAPFSEHQQAP